MLLEVISWTGADQAFTSVTGGEARLKDLHVTIAGLLVAHGCNVGYTPVIGGVDALKYGSLSHVDQTYLRLATYRAANATLIEAQAAIGLAAAWGGGLVASVDGMRFVVPVQSVYARPNPKYFGRRRPVGEGRGRTAQIGGHPEGAAEGVADLGQGDGVRVAGVDRDVRTRSASSRMTEGTPASRRP
nr:Tn3 family transposase [Streptomyces uncialis]